MINQVDETSKIVINKNIQKQADSNAGLFRQTLNRAVDKSRVSQEEDSAPVSSLKEILSAELPVDSRNVRIENKTEKLIQMLDNYSSQLENNDVSLKKIEPFIKEMKTSAGKLLEETSSATDADTKLKNIAEQCAITANAEYLKFQRGDYL